MDQPVSPPARRATTGPWRLPARRAPSLLSGNRVRFLNVEADLTGDWNDAAHDKLWLYNLHYFDDLNAFDAAERADWHRDLVARWIAGNPPGSGNGWEPYPLSLRIVNWVKWLCGGAYAEPGVLQSLAVQVRWLEQSLERHLLGNHLFSNAKALTLAGLFFESEEADRWRREGLRILARELPEQVLPDGGNFERSPMYHALMTEDLLDLVNMAGRYPGIVSDAQLADWRATAERMLAWLAGMSHPDGRIALFNDAAFGIAPENAELARYAADLGLKQPDSAEAQHWPDSGYARLQRGEGVALLDLAPVGPDYLPGHAHADTLSFELSVRGRRVIVNGGTSRYGNDTVRAYERSTAAHSTVEIAGQSSSEVWHGFRVGRRARPFDIDVSEEHVAASHDGYAWLPGAPVHRRDWRMTEQGLAVTDTVSDARHLAVARYILAPEVSVEARDARTFALSGDILLSVEHGQGAIEPAWYSPEFGVRLPTSAIAVTLIEGRAQVALGWG